MNQISETSNSRRQQARVLAINDKKTAREVIKTRLYNAGIGTVVAPISEKQLLEYLFPPSPPDPAKFNLIILDYSFADWDTDVHAVHQKIKESDVAKSASIIILTAFPHSARSDRLLRPYHYEIVDDVPATPNTVEGIVAKYIG